MIRIIPKASNAIDIITDDGTVFEIHESDRNTLSVFMLKPTGGVAHFKVKGVYAVGMPPVVEGKDVYHLQFGTGTID